MKIALLSTVINKLEIAIEAIDFPTAPLVGDFVDIIDFYGSKSKTYLQGLLRKRR